MDFGSPRTAMITAADLGDPDSPETDIHPRNKTEVGRRLSLAAATAIYDIKVCEYSSTVCEYSSTVYIGH